MPMQFPAPAFHAILLAALTVATPAQADPVHGAATAKTEPANTIRLPAIHLHGNALAGKPRALGVDDIDALAPKTEWTIADPYRHEDARYSGVLLRDLVAAVAPQAKKVRMLAVNDYVVVFEKKEWETQPILLATRDGDARMAVANKGPARIVYRQTHENELAMQVNAPKWIWQVIDVEFIGQ